MKKIYMTVLCTIMALAFVGCTTVSNTNWNIVKQMDTFFKYIFMERQNYSCLSM